MKITQVQQGIEGKVAGITDKWSFFILSLVGLQDPKYYVETIAMERLLCIRKTELFKVSVFLYSIQIWFASLPILTI